MSVKIEKIMESGELHVLRVAYIVGLACLSICLGVLFTSVKGYGETLAAYEREHIISPAYEEEWNQLNQSYQEWVRSTSLSMLLIIICDITGAVAVITMSSCVLRGQILFIFTCILCLIINDPFPFADYLMITLLTGLLQVSIISLLIYEMERLKKSHYLPL